MRPLFVGMFGDKAANEALTILNGAGFDTLKLYHAQLTNLDSWQFPNSITVFSAMGWHRPFDGVSVVCNPLRAAKFTPAWANWVPFNIAINNPSAHGYELLLVRAADAYTRWLLDRRNPIPWNWHPALAIAADDVERWLKRVKRYQQYCAAKSAIA